jgi:hypothetical protein
MSLSLFRRHTVSSFSFPQCQTTNSWYLGGLPSLARLNQGFQAVQFAVESSAGFRAGGADQKEKWWSCGSILSPFLGCWLGAWATFRSLQCFSSIFLWSAIRPGFLLLNLSKNLQADPEKCVASVTLNNLNSVTKIN